MSYRKSEIAWTEFPPYTWPAMHLSFTPTSHDFYPTSTTHYLTAYALWEELSLGETPTKSREAQHSSSSFTCFVYNEFLLARVYFVCISPLKPCVVTSVCSPSFSVLSSYNDCTNRDRTRPCCNGTKFKTRDISPHSFRPTFVGDVLR